MQNKYSNTSGLTRTYKKYVLCSGRRYIPKFSKEKSMPTISMFFGIIIRMYCSPKEHNPPHFHTYYQKYKAIIDINTCEMIEGKLPSKQLKLVLAWAEIHKDDLLADWELASNGELPFKISPLQ